MKVVAALSGGLDSTVLAYKLKAEENLIGLMSVNYGQRHKKELSYARQTAMRLKVPFEEINLLSLSPLLKGSALTDQKVQVPHGHYAEDSMRITVVPNRNAILLSLLWAWAVSQGADAVAYAAHAGDAAQYPDCRIEFVASLQHALNEGNLWAGHKDLLSPFVSWSKADIVREGARLNVPFQLSWSCYQGGEKHCGRCGTDLERMEAFDLAEVDDPTEYADRSFYEGMKSRGEICVR